MVSATLLSITLASCSGNTANDAGGKSILSIAAGPQGSWCGTRTSIKASPGFRSRFPIYSIPLPLDRNFSEGAKLCLAQQGESEYSSLTEILLDASYHSDIFEKQSECFENRLGVDLFGLISEAKRIPASEMALKVQEQPNVEDCWASALSAVLESRGIQASIDDVKGSVSQFCSTSNDHAASLPEIALAAVSFAEPDFDLTTTTPFFNSDRLGDRVKLIFHLEELVAYLRRDIPVIAGLSGEPIGHTVVLVGIDIAYDHASRLLLDESTPIILGSTDAITLEASEFGVPVDVSNPVINVVAGYKVTHVHYIDPLEPWRGIKTMPAESFLSSLSFILGVI